VTKDAVNQIMDALKVEVPEQWLAFSECETECGFEWHFRDGSKLWLDFARDGDARIFWRKGKDGKPHHMKIDSKHR